MSTSSHSAILDPADRSGVDPSPSGAADAGLGRLIVFTGPSGVGKGTLLRALLERHPELKLSVSATTRHPRPGEVHGQNYYFLDTAEFEQLIQQDDLLEWAEFAGNYYGTPKAAVADSIRQGEWVILEIEVEGARQIRHSFPEVVQIFVLPPSIQALEERLHQRGQDSEAAIQQRLQRAAAEMAAADEFDVQIVNDDLQAALNQLESALFG